MQLTFFAEEPPASHSVSPDSEKDWMTHVATSCLPLVPLLQGIAPNGWFGRTSPASCPATGGGDFGAFLGMLGQLGYGFAYRVLDAQYFGVAQRRRRVFVVACLGDWRSAAAVLFERHSLQGHPAPSREAGQSAARGVEIGPAGGRFTDLNPTLDTRAKDGPVRNQLAGAVLQEIGTLCVATGQAGAEIGADMAPTLNCNHVRGTGFDASEDGTGRGTPLVPVCFDTTQVTSAANLSNPKAGDPCHPLAAGAHAPAIAFNMHKSGNEASSLGISQDRTDCLRAFEKSPFAVQPAVGMQVRRLTPEECEALQGFPRGYTDIRPKGKPTADGPRYKALGNSWAVPCITWLGKRIQQVEEVCTHAKRVA